MSRLRRVAGLVVLMAVALGGCEERAQEGLQLVEEWPQLTLIEDLRLGSMDDPDAGFTWIRDVTVSPDQLIYVLEAGDQEIRVYDHEGGRLGTIGRRGEGPGEFLAAGMIGFKEDTLWVQDLAQGRMILLSVEGVEIGRFPLGVETTWPTREIQARFTAGPIQPDGLLSSVPSLGVRVGALAPDTNLWLPDLVFNREGRIADTVGVVPWSVQFLRRIEREGEYVWPPEAPSDLPFYVPFEDGIAMIRRPAPTDDTDAVFTVTRTSETGDTLYDRAFRYKPHAFTSAFRERLIWRGGGSLVSDTDLDSSEVESLMRAEMDLPRYQSPISQGIAGQDGSLWLRREDDGGPDFQWLVLDSVGEVVGAVELPRNANLHWVQRDVAYVAVTDDLEVPWLLRYQIRTETRPS